MKVIASILTLFGLASCTTPTCPGDLVIRDGLCISLNGDAAPDSGPDAGPGTIETGPGECGGSCETGVCDVSKGKCVECVTQGQCDRATPFCDTVTNTCVGCITTASTCPPREVCHPDTLTCVGCVDDTDCGGSQPVCDAEIKECVQCLLDTDCDVFMRNEICNTSRSDCVSCVTDAQCTNPTRARCDAPDGLCRTCTSNTQCEALSIGRDICNGGRCDECSVATQETDCAGSTCDATFFTCTGTALGSRGACESCRSDDDCITDHRCLETTFAGAPQGWFCLRRVPDPPPCPRPYTTVKSATSRSGVADDTYCGFDEDNLSCGAIHSLGEPCSVSCLGEGSVCVDLGGAPGRRCTYPCTTDAECPTSAPMNTCPLGGGFCGQT